MQKSIGEIFRRLAGGSGDEVPQDWQARVLPLVPGVRTAGVTVRFDAPPGTVGATLPATGAAEVRRILTAEWLASPLRAKLRALTGCGVEQAAAVRTLERDLVAAKAEFAARTAAAATTPATAILDGARRVADLERRLDAARAESLPAGVRQAADEARKEAERWLRDAHNHARQQVLADLRHRLQERLAAIIAPPEVLEDLLATFQSLQALEQSATPPPFAILSE